MFCSGDLKLSVLDVLLESLESLHRAVLPVFLTVTDKKKFHEKMNLHTCQVIVVCGVLAAILHYASVLFTNSPFQDKTVGSTPQPLRKTMQGFPPTLSGDMPSS